MGEIQTEERVLCIAIGQERPQTRSIQMARTKIYAEWRLQGGGEGEGWQEITNDLKLTNFVINIKDLELFMRVMGKEEM